VSGGSAGNSSGAPPGSYSGDGTSGGTSGSFGSGTALLRLANALRALGLRRKNGQSQRRSHTTPLAQDSFSRGC
jgi:hypothetical protein